MKSNRRVESNFTISKILIWRVVCEWWKSSREKEEIMRIMKIIMTFSTSTSTRLLRYSLPSALSLALSMNSLEHQAAQLSSDFYSHTITISPWSSAVSEQRNFHFCASSLFGIIHQIFSTCSLQLNPRATRAEWTFFITFCDDIISHSYNNGSAKAAADAERWRWKKRRQTLDDICQLL